MEVKDQPSLRFHGVDIIDVNFKSKERYTTEQEKTIDLNIDTKVFFPAKNKNFYNIVMNVELKAERFFDLHLLAIGTFECSNEIDENLRKQFVNINSPAIMFPYVRSFITNFSSSLGDVTGPVLIPTKFFSGELDELLLNQDNEESNQIEKDEN